ncbi:MAG: RES family NAD+ phosphorylase [Chitinophagaceae bacterium]|nr:RES family NAD+ phosphorylase [Chitinophagaceae bacterium]
MKVFRLAREKHALPLSGIGAAKYGARWNPIGIELIYTAQNRSLAMAEVAVHLTLATLPDDYVMLTIDIPESIKCKQLTEANLPIDWQNFPHPSSTQVIGRDFVAENEYCVLIIPSVVTQGDFNVLINPNHKDFTKITVTNIDKFPFDKRIFK